MPTTLLKSACQRYVTAIFVVEFFFNQIVGINSRPVTLLKRSHRRGGFFVNTLELSVLLQKGLTGALFFDKTAGFVYYRASTLLKHFPSLTFSQNVLFKTATFQYMLGKKSVVKSLYRRVAVWTL